MAKVHRVGDANSAGGVVNGPRQSFFRDNGQLVATDGSGVTPHPTFVPPHVGTVTASGAPGFRINGVPVNRVGDPDSCGHPRAATGAVTNLEGY